MTTQDQLTQHDGCGVGGPTSTEPACCTVTGGLRQPVTLAVLAWGTHEAGGGAGLGGQGVVGARGAGVLCRVLRPCWAVVARVTRGQGRICARHTHVASCAGVT
jgi:hypothetical protein